MVSKIRMSTLYAYHLSTYPDWLSIYTLGLLCIWSEYILDLDSGATRSHLSTTWKYRYMLPAQQNSAVSLSLSISEGNMVSLFLFTLKSPLIPRLWRVHNRHVLRMEQHKASLMRLGPSALKRQDIK
ncbi:uncharacterized protein BO66DRAFT_44737 [Aspergillus aculeatinus CBS 121060]|uniref:Uncharacterized protein n=1 Tax=Aspergillus aculeatinus CBS 121060 TaxID=1448322 RepID=A0ACD1HDT5_9EURO|nr:hypothetical protein BO66DRAFT_44737 [Aspergillus aculeatinus CBS 121060]RAH71992.1 hypothetical protein BO66DRAFT_44737 [Aspergillus aculeatinus CBS 121060]